MGIRPSLPIRAVAFDLDGLIFDTEAVFFRTAQDYMSARGQEFTLTMMAAMIGKRAEEAGPALKKLAGLRESPEVFMAEMREMFFERLDREVQPLPGVKTLLDFLDDRKIPACVATSSRLAYAERLLKGHDLYERFAFVLSGDDVTRGKPDPEIYLKAAARFGVESGSLVVFEDSPAGLASARSAGAFAIGIPHEHSPLELLYDAEMVAPRLDDPLVLELFEEHERD